MRGERAGGEKVVAAAALEPADQLAHVRRVVVLGRPRRAQLRCSEGAGNLNQTKIPENARYHLAETISRNLWLAFQHKSAAVCLGDHPLTR